MPQVTSFQIFGAIISVVVAFLMKLAADYMPADGKPPRRLTVRDFLFKFMMSIGAAYFVALYILEKEMTDTWKLAILGVTSFLGSQIVNGLNGVKSDFFTGLFKEMMQMVGRKLTNMTDEPKPFDHGADTEIQGNDEMHEGEQN